MTELFLPFVAAGPVVPVPMPDLLAMILNHPQQGRKNARKHPLLVDAAQNKAGDMVEEGYFDHTSPTGLTANENVIHTGFELPGWYPLEGNNVESLVGAHDEQDALNTWLASPHHRDHILGAGSFYAEQNCVGTGGATRPDGVRLFVFISAPCPEED